MLVIVRRHFWLVGAIAFLACALLAWSGAEQLVQARRIEAPAFEPVPSGPVRAPASRPTKDGDAMVARNMFCSTCTAAPEPGPGVPEDGIPLTSLPLELVATSLASRPASSFATIRNRDSGEQGGYWIGDAIPGAGKLEAISGADAVFTRKQSGRLERVTLLAPEAPVVADNGRRPAGKPNPANPYADRVRAVGDNHYEIDRKLIGELVSNPAAQRSVRFAPHMEGGEIQGFKLLYARRNSIATAIGLRRGDILHEVGGHQLTSANSALEAYAALQSQSRVTATVLRNGKPVTLTLDLR